MNEATLAEGIRDNWIQDNISHKNAGDVLLALTGYRDNQLKTHWLSADGQMKAESTTCVDAQFASLTPGLPEVAWDEREIHDLFGYQPVGHPDLRPLVRTPRWPDTLFPLQKRSDDFAKWNDVEPDNPAKVVEGEGITIMKVGPTHAGIIESGHFVFSIIGENILHLDAHLFQNHRGVEKALESLPIQEAKPLISRICGADTVSHQYNFLSAMENLAGRRVPESVEWLRIILLESERILSHLNDLAQIPAGVGFTVAHQRGLAMKESWQKGLAAIFGHRFLFDAMYQEMMMAGKTEQLQQLLVSLENMWMKWRKLVDRQQGFHDRMHGVGVVKREDAEQLGAVGVALRAAGVSVDMRTIMPLYRHNRIHIPQVTGGDVEARFQVRLQEVEHSFALIWNALEHLQGKNQEASWRIPDDLTGEVVSYSESPHGLNVHVAQMKNGVIERYHVRSGAYRNWPVLALAVAGNAVADFPLINKSFELCYSCADR